MTQITAYKLSDGTIEENAQIAKEKQKRLDLETELYVFFNKYGDYNMSQSDAVQIILENINEFPKINL